MKKGILGMSLGTLLESVVVLALLIVVFLFAANVYQAFFGPDKTALRTYNLVGDNINSLLQSPEQEKSLEFIFTFPLFYYDLSEPTRTLPIQNRDQFKGTMFFLSTNGVIQGPFPPSAVGNNVPVLFLPATMKPEDISDQCDGKACLCFSKEILNEAESSSEQLKYFLENPTKCRSFEPPKGKTIQFEFSSALDIPYSNNVYDAPAIAKGEKAYPLVKLHKTSEGGSVKVSIDLISPSSAKNMAKPNEKSPQDTMIQNV